MDDFEFVDEENHFLIIHLFRNDRMDGPVVSTLQDTKEDSTGSLIWLGCHTMCKYLIKLKLNMKTILELGCGTGLPGILMAKRFSMSKIPGHVTLTDANQNLFSLLEKSISANGVESFVNLKEFDFGSTVQNLKKYDFIMASEIIYPTSSFHTITSLLGNLCNLLEKDGQFVTTYVQRSLETTLILSTTLHIYSNNFKIHVSLDCGCYIIQLTPTNLHQPDHHALSSIYTKIPQPDFIKKNQEFAKIISSYPEISDFTNVHFPNIVSSLTQKWSHESALQTESDDWIGQGFEI